jgi:hypothetical protein
VYFIWEYGREQFVTDYLEKFGIKVVQYISPYLEEWINHNNYHSVGAKFNTLRTREAG